MKRRLLAVVLSLLSFTSSAITPEEQGWIDATEQVYGLNAGKRVEEYIAQLYVLSDKSEEEKLAGVNNHFNQARFVDDIKLWGQADYWATPLEFVGLNAGDCEDFTIAKYFALLRLGVPEEKLRITYVKALKRNKYHVVLAYYSEPTATPVILDNINRNIVPATERKDLMPIYSFNGKGMWIRKTKLKWKFAEDTKQLSAWHDVRRRHWAFELHMPIVELENKV